MQKKSFPTRLAASVTAAGVAGAALIYIFFGTGQKIQVPAYTAKEVMDGDTFITKEALVVRLADTQAPELQYCGGPEAKKRLEQLILNKQIFLYVRAVDIYRRVVGYAYTPDHFINETLIREGYVDYSSAASGYDPRLRAAVIEARARKIGIFSSKCTQTENPKQPSCRIKGNINHGQKIYHDPTCDSQYNDVAVELYNGDEWFCTPEEAKKAGFKPVRGCD